MAQIEHVRKVDDFIKLKLVLVSCTNKEGLVSNQRKNGLIIKGLPENGLIGFIQKVNPEVRFLSTGGTYKLLKGAGMNVIEVAEYTKYPEMKTGLVKSLHPAIHAGILAHKYTKSDDEFMKEQELEYIDAVIVNFYALDAVTENEDSTFEMIRQVIDVGGPSMSHNARKAFISTALITDPENYPLLVEELRVNGGSISLLTRIDLAKKASTMITDYLKSVDRAIQNINIQQLKDGYEISKGDSK